MCRGCVLTVAILSLQIVVWAEIKWPWGEAGITEAGYPVTEAGLKCALRDAVKEHDFMLMEHVQYVALQRKWDSLGLEFKALFDHTEWTDVNVYDKLVWLELLLPFRIPLTPSEISEYTRIARQYKQKERDQAMNILCGLHEFYDVAVFEDLLSVIKLRRSDDWPVVTGFCIRDNYVDCVTQEQFAEIYCIWQDLEYARERFVEWIKRNPNLYIPTCAPPEEQAPIQGQAGPGEHEARE